MADPEHVSLLLEGGVEKWNTWRTAHPRIVPDLVEAELFKADLAGAHANGANLYKANLGNYLLD